MALRTSGMSDDLFRRFRVQDTKAEAIVRLLGVLQQRRRLPRFFFSGFPIWGNCERNMGNCERGKKTLYIVSS